MRARVIVSWALVATGVAVGVATGVAAEVFGVASPLGRHNAPDETRRALEAAVDDERRAIAFYEAVMEVHGDRRPFSNIIHAERRHEAALIGQFRRLGHEVPVDRWAGHEFDASGSFAELCDRSAVAEVRNGRLYGEWIEAIDDPEVSAVFDRLRVASVERHLPAFQRHGSGWHAIDGERLTPGQQQQRDHADAARTAMFKALMEELSSVLSESGTVRAIDVCADRAAIVADRTAASHRVRIGRTSWKLRNPENGPPAWADLALDDRPETPRYFADRAGRLGAIAPIRVAAACLQCHGSPDDVAPDTKAALADRYPADRAIGFAEGDLRGWFWVEVPPHSARASDVESSPAE